MKIDRTIIYKIDNYSYKNFFLLDDQEKRLVLTWRNNKNIRKWMTNAELIPLVNHLKFVDSLSQRDDMYYWLVFNNDSPIGVVNIFSINRVENSSETGYYLNPAYLDSGEGFEFYYYFKLFIHNSLNISKTRGLMRKDNINSYLLITYFGGKIVGSKQIEGDFYLQMETEKNDFDAIKADSNDLFKFARFIRKNKVDMNKLFNDFNTKHI